MWRPYKDAAQAVFPGLPVVIDKFHIVKMANKALEDIRITLAKDQTKAVGKDWMRRKALLRMRFKNLDEKGRFGLGMWLDNEPAVKVAYDLKEAFYDIYDAPTKGEAAERLDAWRESVPAAMKKGKKSFAPLITATKNWREEMLAFFDYPISNGYTEALNGVAKVVNRQGRGYSFEVLRARVLFGRKPPTMPILAEPMTRCMSCQGLFTSLEIASHIKPKNAPSNAESLGILCMACHARFHTGGTKHGHSLSTP
jgi:transposase